MSRKVYVEVAAVFTPEGKIMPQCIRWEDGTLFTVDRVTDIRRAAALKAGGCGLRYTIRIGGRQTYLFLYYGLATTRKNSPRPKQNRGEFPI